jgi:hypothetical protein|eukprot:COSAG02_NODE_14833_length_1231_cov_246.600707_2_plen_52_part_00
MSGAAGRPESRGEYLERNYGAGDTYRYGATGTYDNDAALQQVSGEMVLGRW